MYEYKKLRGRIIEKFGTQEKFSKEIGISETSLSKKMKCKTGISQADIMVKTFRYFARRIWSIFFYLESLTMLNMIICIGK